MHRINGDTTSAYGIYPLGKCLIDYCSLSLQDGARALAMLRHAHHPEVTTYSSQLHATIRNLIQPEVLEKLECREQDLAS